MTSTTAQNHQGRIGCGGILAISFVAVVWMLITTLAVFRAIRVGWPALLQDEGVLALAPFSLGLLVLVVFKRNEIVKGGTVSCPKCDAIAKLGQYSAWQFLVAICFFPLGLLALLAGREPSKCETCSHTWQT